MKIYRVAYRDAFSEHKGYEYFSNKAGAVKADNKNKANSTRDEIEEIEIPATKKGIISALNIYCSYPDNG
jgi:hypothetical protein